MTRLLACLFALGLTAAVAAQAPIPRALVDAKTAYLVNAGAGQGTFDDLANALTKWGRFALVDDPAKADVTITLGGLQAFKGWPLTITTTTGQTPLYTDKQKKGLTKNVADSLVKQLRERLEGKH